MGIAREIAENLKDARDSIADSVGDVAEDIANKVDDFVEDAADVVSELGEEFRDGFQAGTEALRPIVEEAWEQGIKIPLDNAIEKISDIGGIILEGLEEYQEILDAIGQKLLEELLEYLSTLSIVVEFKAKGYARVQVSTSLFNYDIEFDICKGFSYQFELLDWTKVYLFYNFDNGLITFEVKIHDKVITKSWVKLKFAIPAIPIPIMMLKQCVRDEEEEEDDGGEIRWLCEKISIEEAKKRVKENGWCWMHTIKSEQAFTEHKYTQTSTHRRSYSSFSNITHSGVGKATRKFYEWGAGMVGWTAHLELPNSYGVTYYLDEDCKEYLFSGDPEQSVLPKTYDATHYFDVLYGFNWEEIEQQINKLKSWTSVNKDETITSNPLNKCGMRRVTRKVIERSYSMMLLPPKYEESDECKIKRPEDTEVPDVPPITPMDDNCCSMIRQILDRLGGEDFEAKIPKSLTDGNNTQETVKTIPDMIAKTIEYQDELAGEYPVKVEIEDTDLTEEGDQTLRLEFPNQAEFLAELYGLLYEVMKNVSVTQELAYKSMLIAGQNRQALVQAKAQIETIQDYMDFNINEKEKEVEWLFTPGETEWDKILEESKLKINVDEYDDEETTLKQQLLELMQGASIIRARYFQRANAGFDLMTLLKQGASLAETYIENKGDNKKQQDEQWDKFKDFIEDDLMKKYDEAEVKPDINIIK